MRQLSELQIERTKFKPRLPKILTSGFYSIRMKKGQPTRSAADAAKVKELFKNTYGGPVVTFAKGKNSKLDKRAVKIGVVLSGGQAPGGHNVIAGLFDGLKKANPKNKLIGFLGGPQGLLDNKWKEITGPFIDCYRNTGGFDIIQSGRTKIESPKQFEKTTHTLLKNKIDALVVVGGDDSNTNAGLLAEYFAAEDTGINVIGIPKTIDGDLKNAQIETSFGFDTATKTYAELTGNICRDVNSARKYWHFIRLMGRSASHITMEVGFKTQPNIVLIGEEVLAKKMTLDSVVKSIADVVVKRAKQKKDFGVVLVPEGLIEFIPEMKKLIAELNDLVADYEKQLKKMSSVVDKKKFIYKKLTPKMSKLMESLPDGIESQLLLDRDPHGNVQVSQIETEKLLADMVDQKLSAMKKKGQYKGKFSKISHFFGYEGRCGAPSNFDANYTYALGYNAVLLVLNGMTGYMSSVRKLTRKPEQWECGGIPLTMMMNIERRKGKEKPVIQKALVELKGRPFKELVKARNNWAVNEHYTFPGPIQYYGPEKIADMTTMTLGYEQAGKK
ncbi:MAG: diphosphate--fructose-6-phosphate 1-phosphotransferase [Candidatus Goldiibacteriota bacterium]